MAIQEGLLAAPAAKPSERRGAIARGFKKTGPAIFSVIKHGIRTPFEGLSASKRGSDSILMMF